jgi:hypothetical protein
MKKIWLFGFNTFFLVFILNGIKAQEKSPFAESRNVNLKSLLIGQKTGNETFCRGTAFLVKKGIKYYLVTDYHVIPGYNPRDTFSIDCKYPKTQKPCPRPDSVIVFFHTLKGSLRKTYPLYKKNRKLFFTFPYKNAVYQVYDLTFLPITIPKNVIIDTININKDEVLPKRADTIAIYGFNRHYSSIIGLPWCETGTFIGVDSGFGKNVLFVFECPQNLDGDSGAPVYLVSNNHLEFIGMQWATDPLTNQCVFLNKTIIKQFLDKL